MTEKERENKWVQDTIARLERTDPMDFEAAKRGVIAAHKYEGTRVPDAIIPVSSPMAMIMAGNFIHMINEGFIPPDIDNEAVKKSVDNAVRIVTSLPRWEPNEPMTKHHHGFEVKYPPSGDGSPWYGWVSFNSYLREVQGQPRDEWEYEELIMHNCSAIWATDLFCLVCDRPRELHLDVTGELHNESGPAARWSDGTAVWCLRGYFFDEQVIMRPHEQDVAEIQSTTNVEMKRIKIERFGWPRYLKELNAKVVELRFNEVTQTKECLFNCDGMKILMVKDPSSGRAYCPEVPPETATCADAQMYLSNGREERVVCRT